MDDATSTRLAREDVTATDRFGVYEVLERLEKVGPCAATMQLVAELDAMREQVTALVLRAKEAMYDHDLAANRIVESASQNVPASAREGLEDAVLEVTVAMSGSRELYDAMWRLRDAIDPDSRVTVDPAGQVVPA